MDTPVLIVRSAYLKNKGKLDGTELSTGKISSKCSANNFLFYLLELNNSVDDSKVIRKIIQIFENNSKTIVGDITPEMFEKSLTMINQTLDRLARKGDGDWLGNLNAIIGVVYNNDIYLSETGQMIGYLARKNKLSSLTESAHSIQKPISTFSEITSGKIQEDDQIFFCTKNLFDSISLDRIRELLKLKEPSIIVQSLKNILRKTHATDINAAFIKIADINDDFPDSDNAPIYFYLDESDPNFFAELWKKITPYLAKSAQVIKKIAAKLFRKIQQTSSRTKTKLEKNIAPKTKDFVQSNFEKLREKKDFEGIKIKTNIFERRKSSSKTYLGTIDTLLSCLKILIRKENRKYLYGILILIVLSIGYTKIAANNDKRNNKAKEIEISNSYDKALKAYNDARENILLNKTEDLTPLYDALTLAEQAKENPNNQDKSIELAKNINDVIDEKIKAKRYYNATNYKFAENIKNIVLAGNLIVGIDNSGKIYSVDTRDKETKLVASIDKSSGDIIALNFSSSQNRILALTDLHKLFGYDPTTNLVEEIKIEEGEWESATSLATYSSNIYFLDQVNGQIYKHIKKDNVYSKGVKYADTEKATLKNAVDISIDGNLYVLKNDGSITKFVKGSYDSDFSIRGIPSPLSTVGDVKQIITNEDTTNIFILDQKNNRILKFDKSGDYINQYLFDGQKIESFAVNAKLQKLWVLSGGKIYEGSL